MMKNRVHGWKKLASNRPKKAPRSLRKTRDLSPQRIPAKKHSMGNSLEDPITTKEVTYKEWYRCPGLRFHPWFIWLIQQTHEILTMVSVSWNLNTMRFGVHWTSQSSAENKATRK